MSCLINVHNITAVFGNIRGMLNVFILKRGLKNTHIKDLLKDYVVEENDIIE